jgi:hypothetical protein
MQIAIVIQIVWIVAISGCSGLDGNKGKVILLPGFSVTIPAEYEIDDKWTDLKNRSPAQVCVVGPNQSDACITAVSDDDPGYGNMSEGAREAGVFYDRTASVNDIEWRFVLRGPRERHFSAIALTDVGEIGVTGFAEYGDGEKMLVKVLRWIERNEEEAEKKL